MLKRVVVFSPNAVTVGQVLGREVRDSDDTLLAPAGRVVDQPLLDRLRASGLKGVPVIVAPDSMILAIRKAYLEASLDHLFRHWRFSPGMRRLRAMLSEHRTGTNR
ncbi:MAG: hypothetical protein WED00_02150 [Aquisalimonadaceae bacterium]